MLIIAWKRDAVKRPVLTEWNHFCTAPGRSTHRACRGIRPALGFFLCSGAAPYLFERCAAFRRQGMRGVRPRAAGPFSDARKGTKSAHKGVSPLWNPRKGARLWLGGKDTHVSARPDLFFAQTGPATRPKPRRKTPLHSARSGQPAGESAPRWGSFCAAAQHLTFLRCVPQAAEDARSRPGGRLVFCLCKKQGKKHT